MARIGATLVDTASLNLSRINSEMQGDLLGHLRESAEKIKDLAKLNVPTDVGAVEDAITVEKSEQRGINGAFTFKVGVDPDLHMMLVNQRKPQNWKYHPYFDEWLHESTYDLGEKSELKNAVVRSINAKAFVGPKYLSRAYEDLKGGISREAGSIVRRRIAARTIRRRSRR